MIAVLGSKNSGKTATIEALIKELTSRGYKVAAVKHIPEKGFTIDTAGKDTWRFAEAGAETILAVSEQEIAIIRKMNTSKLTIREIVQNCENNASIILVEGFRSLVGHDEQIPKIVAVKSKPEATFALEAYTPVIALTGKLPSRNFIEVGTPYFNIEKDAGKLADLVEKHLGRR